MVIAAAAFYRPLVFWADNAWDFSDPERLLAVGTLIFAVMLVPYVLMSRSIRPGVAALGLAGVLHIALNWHHLRPHPLVWTGAVVAAALVAHFKMSEDGIRWVTYVALAMLAVAPLAQVVASHVRKSDPYPIRETIPVTSAEATDAVQDVVIVVVDSYPSLTLAERWFSHDPKPITTQLDELGFTVEAVGWSQHTFTGLAVPAMLQLGPVVGPGPKSNWGNRSSTYEIVRGSNLVANALQSAGYHQTHFESGWDGGSCGDVDTCVSSGWLDEAMWEMFRPSLISYLLVAKYGYHTVPNSMNVVDQLRARAHIFEDERRDYIYAHLLLPHSPLVVDENCDLVNSRSNAHFAPSATGSADFRALRNQLSCVDNLITEIASLAGPDTAMVIAGDHGTSTGGQLGKAPESWSDAHIAERLGVFLAYRLPASCPEPVGNVNTDVVRSVIACALDTNLPPRDGSFLIGADNPVEIDESRIQAIELELMNGELARHDSGQ